MLEKRCPACRFLGLQKINGSPFYNLRYRTLVKTEGTGRSYVWYDQEPALKTMFEYVSIRSSCDDLERRVIKEDYVRKLLEVATNEGKLNEREYYALVFIDMGDHTYSELGKELGVTAARANQIYGTAFRKMRHPRIYKEIRKYED